MSEQYDCIVCGKCSKAMTSRELQDHDKIHTLESEIADLRSRLAGTWNEKDLQTLITDKDAEIKRMNEEHGRIFTETWRIIEKKNAEIERLSGKTGFCAQCEIYAKRAEGLVEVLRKIRDIGTPQNMGASDIFFIAKEALKTYGGGK